MTRSSSDGSVSVTNLSLARDPRRMHQHVHRTEVPEHQPRHGLVLSRSLDRRVVARARRPSPSISRTASAADSVSRRYTIAMSHPSTGQPDRAGPADAPAAPSDQRDPGPTQLPTLLWAEHGDLEALADVLELHPQRHPHPARSSNSHPTTFVIIRGPSSRSTTAATYGTFPR